MIFRARRVKDDLPVILKQLKQDYPTVEELVRYKQEYKITEILKEKPGIIRTYGLEEHENSLFIICRIDRSLHIKR